MDPAAAPESPPGLACRRRRAVRRPSISQFARAIDQAFALADATGSRHATFAAGSGWAGSVRARIEQTAKMSWSCGWWPMRRGVRSGRPIRPVGWAGVGVFTGRPSRGSRPPQWPGGPSPSTSSTAGTSRGLGGPFAAAAGSIQLSGAAQAEGVDAVVFCELRDDVPPGVPVLRVTVQEQHRRTAAGLGQVQAASSAVW